MNEYVLFAPGVWFHRMRIPIPPAFSHPALLFVIPLKFWVAPRAAAQSARGIIEFEGVGHTDGVPEGVRVPVADIEIEGDEETDLVLVGDGVVDVVTVGVDDAEGEPDEVGDGDIETEPLGELLVETVGVTEAEKETVAETDWVAVAVAVWVVVVEGV